MTLGEQLIAKGRVEERVELVLRFFALKGWEVPDDVRARVLACADEDQLLRWFDRTMAAASFDDVFRADD